MTDKWQRADREKGFAVASFGEVIKEVYVCHKQLVGIPAAIPLNQLDVPDLEKLASSMAEDLNSG